MQKTKKQAHITHGAKPRAISFETICYFLLLSTIGASENLKCGTNPQHINFQNCRDKLAVKKKESD